jgi:hypothetical protein
MALTIYNSPYSYSPAFNQMIFTLSSTNYTQQNFRYIADVYVNGSASYTRLECVANPNNNYGVFDVSGIIQNFLSIDPQDNTTTFKQCENSIVSYIVKFGEQYGASSGITNYPNLTNSSGYSYNGVFDPLNFLDYAVNSYVDFDVNSKFLTDTPRLVTRIGEKLSIGFMTQFTFNLLLRIKVYNSAGTLQKTVYINDPYYSLTKDRSQNIDVSYDWLNTLVTGDLASGTAPIFNASSNYYTVQLVYEEEPNVYQARSEERTIYIEDYCSKYDPIRFKFLNNYGKYDYFTFTGAKTKNTDIKKNIYKSNPNQWATTNYNYSTTSRGATQYETILNDTITIQSDWITEDESVWLEQLMTSPDVYIYSGSDLVAVNITNTSYATKYEASEQLFNLSISFQYSQNRKRQRR